MSVTLKANERSWAIQLIQEITSYVKGKPNFKIKRAGGETTINTGKQRMLPTTEVVGAVTEYEMELMTQKVLAYHAQKAAEYKARMEVAESVVNRIETEKNRILKQRDNLLIELDEAKDWFSIKRMQKLNPNVVFKYSVLKKESKKLGYDVKKVFDANYGEVDAYHKDVYESLYFDTLDFGD